MRKLLLLPLVVLAATLTVFGSELWSDKPADDWNGYYPVGNGVMGAMINGGAETHLQFNHTRLWSGRPHCYDHEGAYGSLAKLRELTFAGKKKEARDLANKAFMGVPEKQACFQPCGDLRIKFDGKIAAFKRSLELARACHEISFELDGVKVSQETFAPYDAPDFIFHKIVAAKPIDCEIVLSTVHPNDGIKVKGNEITIEGEVEKDGVRFAIALSVALKDKAGKASLLKSEMGLIVRNADDIECRITAATNIKSWKELAGNPMADCMNNLRTASAQKYDDVKNAHIGSFAKLYNRVKMNLKGDAALAELPTEERLKKQSETHDPAFAQLVFDYGRYLLISSSREGGEPANLQGIWNKDVNPAWGSKYTCNINVQMNYWPAEVTDLGECVKPLVKAVKELSESGTRTAKTHYNAPGWVLHHNFDVWRGTAPVDGADWGMWQVGGAWMCMHLWERWLYSQDRAALEEAYPIMRGAAEFFTETLVEHPKTGNLVTNPSLSPEHGGIVAGPAMDMQLVRALYSAFVEASKLLGRTDDQVLAKVQSQLPRLEPDHIGKWGQLQEWIEDVDSPTDTHRHFSHLWTVYPGSGITTKTPEFLNAAKVSMIARGDEATGWSMGWKINVWARLHDGDHAMVIMDNLFRPAIVPGIGQRGGLYPNLFDAHPPFQIDGNFGACAGIAEMLLQSHLRSDDGTPEIELLPALPTGWKEGSVKGLCARGNFKVSIEWRDGKLASATVTARANGAAKILYNGKSKHIVLKKGAQVVLGKGDLVAGQSKCNIGRLNATCCE